MVHPVNPTEPSGGHEPLDATDLAILDRIHHLYDQVDPVPPGLADWLACLIELGDMDVQILRLTTDTPAAARGLHTADRMAAAATTITFENAEMTIMLRLDRAGDGTLRVDGWLAPAEECDIDLRTPAGLFQTRSDHNGRFAFVSVPQGLAHLVVRGSADPSGAAGRTTVTQSVML
jgi:hypothetical protein